jgi:signal transduction histidine kinase
MCRIAARQQIEIQQQNYDEFFNFLHSHVKAGVAAVKAEWGNDAAMLEKLTELEQAVSDRRIELLLARQQVPLAALISERIRAFSGVLEIKDSPRVGAITVSRPVGLLISRALGDLLKNVALYGGDSVIIHLSADSSGLVLDIIDAGPGFEPSVLNDESKSLYRLRRDAEQLGGSLSAARAQPGGAHLRLFVPMQSSSNREIRYARIAR